MNYNKDKWEAIHSDFAFLMHKNRGWVNQLGRCSTQTDLIGQTGTKRNTEFECQDDNLPKMENGSMATAISVDDTCTEFIHLFKHKSMYHAGLFFEV